MLAYGLLFASKCDGIQLKEENVSVDSIMGHGGLFKTLFWDSVFLQLH